MSYQYFIRGGRGGLRAGQWAKKLISLPSCAGVRLDSRSCEVLEAVLSRVQMATLDLQRTNLEDEVKGAVLD